MDDLQKMLLKERQQKDKEAEQDMMQRMQYLEKTVSSDQREEAIKRAMELAAQNSNLQEYGEEGKRAAELLKGEQEGTPAQRDRFARLRDIVLKQKYPGKWK
jgi:hypothetical protein